LKRLKLLSIARRAGVATRPYPYGPAEAPEGFRGRPYINHDRCIGCGSCASACPSDAIEVEDLADEGYRKITLFLGRCMFCGRCSDVCPEGAIELTKEFELASRSVDELCQVVMLRMVRCKVCGEYFATKRSIDRLLRDLPKDLWDSLTICPECKGRSAAYVGSLKVKA